MQELIKNVELIFNVDLNRKDKCRDIAEARHALSYLLRKYTNLSYRKIGEIIKPKNYGYSRHCSAIYSERKCRQLMEIDRNYEIKIKMIEENYEKTL